MSSEVARILSAANTEGSRAAHAWAHTGLHLPQRRQSLMESEIVLISDCVHDQRFMVAKQAEARSIGAA